MISLAPRATTTVSVYIDSDNLFIRTQEAHGRGVRLRYEALLDYAARIGDIQQAVVYTSRPAASTYPSPFEFALRRAGFRVVSHKRILLPDGKEKSLADVALALDVGMALAGGRTSYLIIGSGDSSFLPLADRAVALQAEIEFVGPDRGSSGHLLIAASRFTPLSKIPGLVTYPAEWKSTVRGVCA